MSRKINFSAGPSAIPLGVLEHAKAEFTDYRGEGYSIMEISHRCKTFEEIHFGAMEKIRKLYGIGDEYEILFLQGGAHLQFSMIPMNLYQGGRAEYVNTGVWTNKAIKEAKVLGVNVDVVASSEDENFSYIPEFKFSDDADYAYICSNNTIYGTQYKAMPKTKSPLVVDASSDFFARPLDFSSIGLLYGGAQKNAGPSGVTIVILRKDLVDRVSSQNVPMFLRYKTHVEANSLYNTPPTFGIYLFRCRRNRGGAGSARGCCAGCRTRRRPGRRRSQHPHGRLPNGPGCRREHCPRREHGACERRTESTRGYRRNHRLDAPRAGNRQRRRI